MAENLTLTPFEKWYQATDAEMKRRTLIDLEEAGYDGWRDQFLRRVHREGDTPLDFVLWHIEKYGLDDVVAEPHLAP